MYSSYWLPEVGTQEALPSPPPEACKPSEFAGVEHMVCPCPPMLLYVTPAKPMTSSTRLEKNQSRGTPLPGLMLFHLSLGNVCKRSEMHQCRGEVGDFLARLKKKCSIIRHWDADVPYEGCRGYRPIQPHFPLKPAGRARSPRTQPPRGRCRMHIDSASCGVWAPQGCLLDLLDSLHLRAFSACTCHEIS